MYATQSLAFRAPVLVGQAVTAEVTLTRITGRKASFDTRASLVFSDKHRGSEAGSAAVAVDGKALALLPPGSETRER